MRDIQRAHVDSSVVSLRTERRAGPEDMGAEVQNPCPMFMKIDLKSSSCPQVQDSTNKSLKRRRGCGLLSSPPFSVQHLTFHQGPIRSCNLPQLHSLSLCVELHFYQRQTGSIWTHVPPADEAVRPERLPHVPLHEWIHITVFNRFPSICNKLCSASAKIRNQYS